MILMIDLGEDLRQAAQSMRRSGAALLPAIRQGLDQGAKQTAARISEDKLSGGYLKARTGALRQAVRGWMASDLEAVVGVPSGQAVDDYKWLLGDDPDNQPMTIVPRKGQYLAIPIGEALTSVGVLKAEYSVGLRKITDGFFFQSRSGQLMFGIRKGKTKRARVRPLFVLVRSVEIYDTGAIVDQVTEDLDSGRFLEPVNRRIEEAFNQN